MIISASKSDWRNQSDTTNTLYYATIFPVGFFLILFTGAELFTGRDKGKFKLANVMTMVMSVMAKRIPFTFLIANWS